MVVSPRRAFLLASLLLASAPSVYAAETRIDLYTIGPGDDLFSKFGHAALCVSSGDPKGDDLCYNYGTADFSRPIGLGWEVVRGRALFWVSTSDRRSTVGSFAAEDRTIYRQALPLAEKQAERLASALAADALPENSEYVYSHFLENCSTRPRDHIDRATGGALRRVRLRGIGTYRDYAAEGLSRASILLVPANDFLLGRWVDREIGAYEAMFIPDVLREAVETAFDAAPETVYERKGPAMPSRVEAGKRLTWIAGSLLCVASWATLLLASRGRRAFRRVGGALLGGLGAILLFAALVSALPELRRNELLLVFFPLDFLLLSSNHAFVRSYATMRLGVLLLVAGLAAAGVLVQPLWPFWLVAAGVLGAIRAGASGGLFTSKG